MNSKLKNLVFVMALILLVGVMNSCSVSQSEVQQEQGDNAPSEKFYKPWAYWWWMGSSVTKDGITKNLEEYQKAGMGGMHIIPIYGEKGDEENFIEYLSPEWMEMLSHTVAEAERLGMGIDMTPGTGWPFGGPKVTYEHSAKRVEIVEVDVKKTNTVQDILKPFKESQVLHLSGQKANGEIEDITESIDEHGGIHFHENYKKVCALVTFPTRQKVKRAAPGGEGLVIDYFNQNSLDDYFGNFERAFANTAFSSGKVRSFYNDSYEVYRANFTDDYLEEFKSRNGYDLKDHLFTLLEKGNSEVKERIITDYCETVSDLLYSEFTLPWVEKCHKLGMVTRNQAHGSPGNILDLYAAVDIPETESFGVSDFKIPGLKQDPDFEEERFGRPNPLTMKFASSAAHIAGRKLVGSETATWLGDHFKVALSQVKPQIDELFVAGINHIIYHGITYNPPEKPFPGRLFYASTNFGIHSHFWNELPALNKYIERCQSILQNSTPDNDVLLYFPIHDIWAKKYTKEFIVRFDVHHSDHWLKESNFGELAADLWKQGYTFDFVSDKMLNQASFEKGSIKFDGGNYKTIVVPECTYMPEETLGQLRTMAEQGADIIFQKNLPDKVSGYANLEERNKFFNQVSREIESLVEVSSDPLSDLINHEVDPETMAGKGLSFIRKKVNKETIYFISNLSDEFYRDYIQLSNSSKHVLFSDPLTGKSGTMNSSRKDGKTQIFLNLEPGQSCIIRCNNKPYTEGAWKWYEVLNKPHKITSPWSISTDPMDGTSSVTRVTEELNSWTTFGENWENYIGKVQYKGKFTLGDQYVGKSMLLDLKDVRETARVKINGKDLGLLWSIPYKVIIPEKVLRKSNSIEIEVTNLSFNKVIELDRKGVEWKNFYEINFVNIGYKPYDASDKEPVESGLLSEIKLYPVKQQ